MAHRRYLSVRSKFGGVKRRYWVGLTLVLLLGVSVGGVHLVGTDPGSQSSARYLSVEKVDGDESRDQTIAFSNLNSGQQRVFEAALSDETTSERIPDDVNEQVWVENRYVRYENQTYAVAVAVP